MLCWRRCRQRSAAAGGRDPLLDLDLGLDGLDRVRRLDLEQNGPARRGFDEDLHPAAEPEHLVECRPFLDALVAEGLCPGRRHFYVYLDSLL